MNKVCTICARGGSKGVKNKNLIDMLGLPLIAHSIMQAKRSKEFVGIAISSDSDEILEAGRKFGADFLIKRPDEMATDVAAKLPAIRHCVESVEMISNRTFDIIVDLDATSPLRLSTDISGAIKLLFERQASNVITGTPSRRSPYFNLVEENSSGFVATAKTPDQGVIRRQDAPPTFDMNASIYVWTRESLFVPGPLFQERTCLFEMPDDRSLDIDSPLDLEIVRIIMERRREKYRYD